MFNFFNKKKTQAPTISFNEAYEKIGDLAKEYKKDVWGLKIYRLNLYNRIEFEGYIGDCKWYSQCATLDELIGKLKDELAQTKKEYPITEVKI